MSPHTTLSPLMTPRDTPRSEVGHWGSHVPHKAARTTLNGPGDDQDWRQSHVGSRHTRAHMGAQPASIHGDAGPNTTQITENQGSVFGSMLQQQQSAGQCDLGSMNALLPLMSQPVFGARSVDQASNHKLNIGDFGNLDGWYCDIGHLGTPYEFQWQTASSSWI